MTFSLTWLPQVLKDSGLKVALTDGWENRGQCDVENIVGVICHHTATPGKKANMPTLNTLIQGRSDLSGPLAQLGLGPGRYVLCDCCWEVQSRGERRLEGRDYRQFQFHRH
jgi:hypothetical protein